MCEHLHLKRFDSGTEYGYLWACLDCPDVFYELPSPLCDLQGADVFHNEVRVEEIRSIIPASGDM